jgi:dihydrofolate reductase
VLEPVGLDRGDAKCSDIITVGKCLRAGQLDEIQIHLVPVLLGSGVRLFDHLGTENIELEIIRVVDSPGVSHLRFHVVR